MIDAPDDLDLPRHAITVERLTQALGQLRATDIIVPNAVGNLAVIRDGAYLAWIDLSAGDAGTVNFFDV